MFGSSSTKRILDMGHSLWQASLKKNGLKKNRQSVPETQKISSTS
jgi:hypothetical protein